tara:strand:+ start:252 stop:497 length:246 start_codon:yes stop_codon:yes gene_type:complete
MKENERDFKKVLESINSLESKITSLEIFVKESLVKIHEMNKQDITHQHKVNLDNCKQIGDIIDLISVHTDSIQEIKGKIGD